eukprot:TRINITY_DN9202_c0_g3_i1.p3 TRINITY_DN9202_c0_g3~~TRINITY_DN9202_c0_g3_i1.p3  ORF type:complete len:288 (+),score=63.83 TRINITY_DN9202_c0_g3_i1:1448-2311(+)
MSYKWWDWHKSWSGGYSGDSAGCVHRLDRETSGCLVRAKTSASFDDLSWQFKRASGNLNKVYVALVYGYVNPKHVARIESKLSFSFYSNKAYVDEQGGEWAETHVKCLAHLEREGRHFSLVAVRILTGRTHQIRVHLESVAHPLVSDSRYNPMVAAYDVKFCTRLFLHAYQLTFTDAGEEQTVNAPLPSDLRRALAECRLVGDCLGGTLFETLRRSGRLPEGLWTKNSLEAPSQQAARAAPPPPAASRAASKEAPGEAPSPPPPPAASPAASSGEARASAKAEEHGA